MNTQMPRIVCTSCDDTGWDKDYDTPCYCAAGIHMIRVLRADELREFDAHADDALSFFTQGE